MDRRSFIEHSATAAAGVAFSSCARPLLPRTRAGRRAVQLVPVEVAWDRIIRTTVGLRPHRPSGFMLRAERLDDHMLIHNFGHGGSGMSLSWGTGYLAAELSLEHTERRAAVIGSGIVGLTTARQLQRRGFDVTIYAMALPPETTWNMSFAGFTPTSGLVERENRTPIWDAQFRRAVDIAYREHQLLVGRGYGVSWIDEYGLTDNPEGGGGGLVGPPGGEGANASNPLLDESFQLRRVLLEPGEHPFATRYARVRPGMRFEPSIYLEALMRDVLAFGGRIVVRRFDTPRDLMTLEEPILVNCTGLGSKALFGDDELVPVKGQLVVLVPQPDVTYTVGGMMPRSDGIVLGHLMERGRWSLEVNVEARTRVVESAMRLFGAMRLPQPGSVPTGGVARGEPPPVESFFGRVS